MKTQAAIKVLHTQIAEDNLQGFFNEAQTIGRLRHPHIVRVLDFGVQNNTPFLVMDYAPRGTLRQLHPRGSRLPLSTIVGYVRQIADALQYAHSQKLIHRDIKPENMLLGSNNEILLSDFGIATMAQSSHYQMTQEVVGTVSYMAPEQIQGKPRSASDEYALGIVIYEWLTGSCPFQGSFTEVVTQHVFATPPPIREKLPTIPPDLEQVLLMALAKDPQQRFATLQAFATALEQACQPMREGKQAPREGIQIFFSYARRDQSLRDQLENHLSNLKYRRLISTWHEREIIAGEEWEHQIDIHLATAHIILLLISASFMASEYCYSIEMKRALERHEQREADVIPILLRPVLYTDAPFAKLRMLPANGKPIVNWRNRDSAFVDIALGIERVVQKRLTSVSLPAPEWEIFTKNVGAMQPAPPAPAGIFPTYFGVIPPAPPSSPLAQQQDTTSLRVTSRGRIGLFLVGLSLLGLLSAGVLLVQHPNFIPFVGVIVGSLVLLAGILLAIRALVKRAQSRATQRREQEQAQSWQLEEARKRDQQRELQRQEERRREQEEARHREFEEARRLGQERAYYENALAVYEQALRQNNADATVRLTPSNSESTMKNTLKVTQL